MSRVRRSMGSKTIAVVSRGELSLNYEAWRSFRPHSVYIHFRIVLKHGWMVKHWPVGDDFKTSQFHFLPSNSFYFQTTLNLLIQSQLHLNLRSAFGQSLPLHFSSLAVILHPSHSLKSHSTNSPSSLTICPQIEPSLRLDSSHLQACSQLFNGTLKRPLKAPGGLKLHRVDDSYLHCVCTEFMCVPVWPSEIGAVSVSFWKH